jgi:hypothetical protein
VKSTGWADLCRCERAMPPRRFPAPAELRSARAAIWTRCRDSAGKDRLAFAATCGISQTLRRPLAAVLRASAGRVVGFAICTVLPFASISRVPGASVFATIKEAIDGQQPALDALLGACNHYTVIIACTTTGFVLHDSYGYHWITKASCGVRHDGSTSRHQIATCSIIVLRLR